MEQNKTNGKAIASLSLSCLSIVCSCTWYLSIALGVLGVVFGILALRGENENQRDVAIAGIVVGAVGLALAVTVAVLYIMLYSAIGESGTGTVPDAGSDTAMTLLRTVVSFLQ